MKIEGLMFGAIAGFLFLVDVIYWYLSRDWAGATVLAFSGGLAFIIGYYLLFTARRMQPRPEDRADADISDGSGEVGFFSPHSWWPIALAVTGCMAGLGLIFGTFLLIIGGVALLMSLTGLLFEYYWGLNRSRAHTQSHIRAEMLEQAGLPDTERIQIGH